MVHQGQRVALGTVQFVSRSWYLVTADGHGLKGNKGRSGGPGVGCGCWSAVSRMVGGPTGSEPVRYLYVGGVPADHAGRTALGYICAKCNRALARPVVPPRTDVPRAGRA